MNTLPFTSKTGNCKGTVTADKDWNITVQGACNIPNADTVKYAAAAPADLRMGRAGSGLPYPSEQVAYEGSPNIGEVPVKHGRFSFKVVSPNCYYVDNGSKMVHPHVHFTIGNEYFDVPLPNAMRFANRSLTALPGRYNRASGR